MRRWLLALLLLGGCVVAPDAPIATYDLGLPPITPGTGTPLLAPLSVAPVAAPAWLNSSEIVYRLLYQDPARSRSYGYSRWVAPPAALLTQRVRQQLDLVAAVASTNDGVTSQYVLRMELEEFTQVFDTPNSSRALVRLRAILIDAPSRKLLAQRTFSVEGPARTPDASGAVSGLSEASDGALHALLEWLNGEMSKVAKGG